MNNNGIYIEEIESYLPPRVVTNAEFETMVDTSDEWITSRTGISSRHFAQDESNTDMAEKALKKLLEKSKVDPEEIALLAVGTFSPDDATPSVSCQIHERTQLPQHIMTFDYNAACAGFIYGAEIVKSMIPRDDRPYAILVCSEKITTYVDFTDRSTCVLFGDGAVAMLVKRTSGLYHSYFGTKGNKAPLHCSRPDLKIKMQGNEVFRFAVGAMEESILEVLKKAGIGPESVDHFVPHQANARIIANVSKRMKLDKSKLFTNLKTTGNTSAASIPICLAEMNSKGILKRGDRVLTVAFGAGLTYGANLFTW